MKLFDNLFICVNYSALDRANRDELVVLARDLPSLPIWKMGFN